jgi:hypothetical protein
MAGIPANLDLSFLLGAEVVQVCLGIWQVQIQFEPLTSLTVEGDWELANEEGQVIDRSSDTMREEPFHLHLLLQRVVVAAAEVSAPLSFALRFTGGLILRVFVPGWGESFSLQPANIFV